MGVFLKELQAVFTFIISLFGEFLTELTTAETGKLTALLPMFILGIGVSLLWTVIKSARKVSWGA